MLLASIGAFAQITVSIDATPDTICAGSSATLTANVSGGAMPYSYTWSDTQTKSSITVTPTITTTYSVTVIDNNSATNTAQIVVTGSPQMTATISNEQDASCGLSNGTATVTATGGIPNSGPSYNYLWSTGNITPTISNVLSGYYCVTVYDMLGCTAIACVNIGNSPAVSLTTASTSATCFPNGTATVNMVTGTAPCTYTWGTTPPQYTQTATNISSGTYNVTVTDNNGCIATSSVVVGESNTLALTMTSTPEHFNQIDGTAS